VVVIIRLILDRLAAKPISRLWKKKSVPDLVAVMEWSGLRLESTPSSKQLVELQELQHVTILLIVYKYKSWQPFAVKET
jgi:hypothetical protein